MEYTQEILIDLTLDKTAVLMNNADNLRHWQEGFVAIEHLEGTPGEVGAKSNLKYKMGKRNISMIETITLANWPNEFHATYEAKNVCNWQENRFEAVDENQTKWTCRTKFKFDGTMRFLAPLMKSAFKKQSFKFLQDFKSFAESA